jgi:pyruvyl transferase EpsO
LCDYNRISENDIILLHGGGNFGDLYRPIQEFRLRIVEKFPNNKIIFLPQTIHYNNEEVLIADINSLNKHNNLTICVRDTNSYSLIKNRLVKPSLLLLPDMAFCVDLTRFHTNANNNRKLFLKRTDKELALQSFEFESSESIDILDWPSYKKQLENILFDLIGVISKKMFRIEQARKFMNHKTGFLPYALREKQLISGINFINQYPEIYSNRLHGFILAILLNKKVFLLDNNYGKNSSYYNTWMQSFTNLLIIK